jgi:ABC-2 type transport system permease protein
MAALALFRTEMVKTFRRPRTYVAYGILVVIPIIMALAIDLNPPERRGEGQGLLYLASHTGLLLPAFALRVGSVFLLVVIVSLFGGDAIAGEASWGNLRYVLMRPIRRGRLVATKFVVAMLHAWFAVALIVLTGLTMGVIVFGAEPIGFPLSIAFGEQSRGQILVHLLASTGYVAWGLTGIVAFAFMISCMTDAPFGAIFAGVGLYFTSTILDAITSLGNIRYVLPTHYNDAWIDLMTHDRWSTDMLRGVGLQLGYVLLFALIGAWWFRRKDILS